MWRITMNGLVFYLFILRIFLQFKDDRAFRLLNQEIPQIFV